MSSSGYRLSHSNIYIPESGNLAQMLDHGKTAYTEQEIVAAANKLERACRVYDARLAEYTKAFPGQSDFPPCEEARGDLRGTTREFYPIKRWSDATERLTHKAERIQRTLAKKRSATVSGGTNDRRNDSQGSWA